MLQCVDAEAIAIGQRYPVFIAAREIIERRRAIEVDVAEPDEVGAAKLRVRIFQAACRETALSGAGVAVFVLQLSRPDAVVRSGDYIGQAGASTPSSARIKTRPRLIGRVIDIALVYPIVPGMVEDDIEDDAQARCVRSADQVDQLRSCAESRIDLEEILDRAPVIAVVGRALLEHRTEPYHRHTKLRKVG